MTLVGADAVALAEVLDRRSLEACGRGTLTPSRLQEGCTADQAPPWKRQGFTSVSLRSGVRWDRASIL